jgi:hypothetical protein
MSTKSILMLALLAGIAHGQSNESKNNRPSLLDQCKALTDEQKCAACLGRSDGYLQGWQRGDLKTQTKLINSGVCLPVEATDEQLGTVLLKYLNDHPNRLHENASKLTITAFKQAFPCRIGK